MWFTSDLVAQNIFHNPDAENVLKLFALSIPLVAVSTVAVAVLQSFREVRWRTSVKYLVEPVTKTLFTMGLFWAGLGLSAVLIAMPMALVLTTALMLLPVRHLLSKGNGSTSVNPVYSDVLQYSLPLLGGLVFVGLATRSDVLLLGYWVPVEQVGIYSAAFQTSAAMAVVLGALDSIATPFLSESITRNEQDKIRLLAGTVVRWTLTATVPLFLVMAMFAREIMALFGRDFESGWTCLIILAFGQFVNSAMGSSNSMLLWAGRSKLVMWNSVLTSAAQISLYLILIPSYGAVGASFATATGIVLVVMVRIVQVRYVLNVWPYDSATLKPVTSGSAALLVVVFANTILEGSHPLALVGLFMLVYAGFLYALGIHSADRALLLQVKQRFSQSG